MAGSWHGRHSLGLGCAGQEVSTGDVTAESLSNLILRERGELKALAVKKPPAAKSPIV